METQDLSISVFLVHLRSKLLDAKARKDTELLERLSVTLGMLEEVMLESGDRRLYNVTVNLGASAIDALNDEEWKSTIPSIEEILSLSK
jgi:hypothetical protein